MGRFENVRASVESGALCLQFTADSPATFAWQALDPQTGAFLFEGQQAQAASAVSLKIEFPPGDGPYRIRVAPAGDSRRFVQLDAEISDGRLTVQTPVVTSEAALRWGRLARGIPKAFVYPARSLWENRGLIRSMVRRDILARYRGSFGGTFWTLLNPLLLLSTYFFVFGVVFKTRFAGDSSRWGYVLYFVAGMLPWLAFAEAVGRSASVILEYRNFVKKLVFPLDILPVNLVISGVVTEMVGLVIFLIALIVARSAVPAAMVWFPLVLIPQLLFTAGLCWFLSALGVFVRDLGQIIGFLLTLWLYLTPIFYPETQVPALAAQILAFNPMWALVRGYRMIFLENRMPDALLPLWAGSLFVALLGYGWFHRLRGKFADTI